MSKARINVLLDEDDTAKNVEPVAGVLKKRRPLEEIDLPVKTRGAAGAIAEAIESLSERSKRGEEIEARFANAEAILEIDPALIDPSFARDRMAAFEPEGADAEFVAAIRSEGQLVPALLRPNPAAPGRFQPAYGRRRIAAAAFLGRKVRAVVRDLSDEQLVVAQGQENEARNGLTFIEKCRFAATLETQGFKRKVIESALSIDKTHVSRMLRVVERVPASVVDWIGPASEIGRRKWLDFAEAFGDQKVVKRAEEEVSKMKLSADNFPASSARFDLIVNKIAAKAQSARTASTLWALPGQKKHYGSIDITPRRVTLTIDRSANPAIADALIERVEVFRRELEAAAFANQPKKG